MAINLIIITALIAASKLGDNTEVKNILKLTNYSLDATDNEGDN